LFWVGMAACLCFSAMACTAAFVIMLVDKTNEKNRLESLDVEKDFPVVNNATIIALWYRPTLNRESCGQYCDVDVCYDDWIAEFAWTGTPASGPFAVVGSQLTSTTDNQGCHCPDGESCPSNPCNLYSSFRQYNRATTAVTYSAVSQGWRQKRCEGSCGGSRCGGDRNSCIGYSYPRASCGDLNYRPSPPSNAFFGLSTSVPLREPSMGAADVPNPYRCPTAAFNPLCVRLGLMPLWELEGAHSSISGEVDVYTILTGIFAPITAIAACVACVVYGTYSKQQ